MPSCEYENIFSYSFTSIKESSKFTIAKKQKSLKTLNTFSFQYYNKAYFC